LKGSLYERSNSLVGIYRDQDANSSRTLTLDVSGRRTMAFSKAINIMTSFPFMTNDSLTVLHTANLAFGQMFQYVYCTRIIYVTIIRPHWNGRIVCAFKNNCTNHKRDIQATDEINYIWNSV
jgi:hypothetical protein